MLYPNFNTVFGGGKKNKVDAYLFKRSPSAENPIAIRASAMGVSCIQMLKEILKFHKEKEGLERHLTSRSALASMNSLPLHSSHWYCGSWPLSSQ
jgi:hypothetical protein